MTLADKTNKPCLYYPDYIQSDTYVHVLNDDGRRPIAIDHTSNSGDLKIQIDFVEPLHFYPKLKKNNNCTLLLVYD